ncbi:MAG: glycosyltransferase [Alphaproteobacteria bacterium]|nr:glycosyltransferase [Alphaproteobacteria bacterium]
MPQRNIANVMPYYNEPSAWIEQAIESVRRQTVPCALFMVADGVARDDIKMAGMEDLRLPERANDGGATPRTTGGRAAIEAGHDVIAYLDADDILEPDFAAEILRGFDAGFDCVGVPAQRVTTGNEPLTHPDGALAVTWVPSRSHEGIGNLCFIRACGLALTGASLALNEVWMRIPSRLGGTCDLFWSWAAFDSPAKICWTLRPSYRYRITNADIYPTYGLAPPPDATHGKTDRHNLHHDAWNGLDHTSKARILDETGIKRGYKIREEDAAKFLTGNLFSDALLALDNGRSIYIPGT